MRFALGMARPMSSPHGHSRGAHIGWWSWAGLRSMISLQQVGQPFQGVQVGVLAGERCGVSIRTPEPFQA
jgi:hypothetical protein